MSEQGQGLARRLGSTARIRNRGAIGGREEGTKEGGMKGRRE